MKQTKAALSGGQRFHRKATARLGYDIADIHARVGDLADWIGNRYGVLVSTRRGKTTHIECPKHEPGHTTSAYVTHWPDGQTFRCERCVIGPVDVIDLVVALGEVNDRGAAIRMLAAETGASTVSTFTGKQQRRRPILKPPKPPLEPVEDTDRRPDAVTAARIKTEYLTHRAWSDETWEHAGLEVVRVNGQHAVRHPYRANSSIYWWQDRVYKRQAGRPKWLNPSGKPPWLYNGATLASDAAHFASWAAPWNGLVHITEGAPDAIALLDTIALTYPVLGVPGAAQWRPEWTRALSGLHVIVSGHNDDAGRGFAAKISAELDRVAASSIQMMPPQRYNDLADWTAGVGESAAFDQLMPAIEQFVIGADQ